MLVTITPTLDLLNLPPAGTVQVALFAELNANYTPTYGPSAKQPITQGTWVYLCSELDYAPVSGPVSGLLGNLPAFVTYNPMTPGGTFTLPEAQASGRIIFGVPVLPTIVITNDQPVMNVIQAATYDYVEFTSAPGSTPNLYIDTSAINQFGIPIQLQIDPPQATLPNGSGVFLDRADVLSQYQSSFPSPSPFQAGVLDMFGETIPAPLGILSPASVLTYNCVQGVAVSIPGASSQLAAGTYYYVVTAMDSNNNSSYAQPMVASISVDGTQAVTIAWAPNSDQTSGDINQYPVYRGTPANGGVTWELIACPLASQFSFGGAALDQGQAALSPPPGVPATPPFSPLATWFDAAVQSFFNYYLTNALSLSAVNYSATSDTEYWNYSFSGTTVVDPVTNLPLYLQLAFTGAVDLTTMAPVASGDLPFPVGTPLNIYYPYWNTNTYSQNNPAAPSWAPFPDWPASMMVFAANGVFADNLNQVYYNLPSGITAPPPPPSATNLPVPPSPIGSPPQYTPAYLWQSLLGTLENMVVSALTRGIAAPLNGAPPIAPVSWASQPQQAAPTPSAASPSSLTVGATYYYVITTLNGTNESAASLEFAAAPTTTENPSVQINWVSLQTWQATAFNIYRGEQSQGENMLVATVTNSGTTTSWVDSGGGTSQSPPAYYPAGVSSNGYCPFLHQPSITFNGAEYAFPYDDQGNQSSTLAGTVTSLTITVGPWSSS